MLGPALWILAFAPPAPEVHAPRGNEVLLAHDDPRYGVGAALRIPVLVGEASRLSQPVGFGFGLQLRLHPWRSRRVHLGFALFAGHLRVPKTVSVPDPSQPGEVFIPRQQVLSHTDFAGGLSMHVPLGPLVVLVDVGGGVAISTFSRPVDARADLDEVIHGADPLLRGGPTVFIPIRDDHGFFVGASAIHIFAPDLVVAADGTNARPFSTVLDLGVGYMAFF